MNINTTSEYMDKQIMDLSNSQSSITSKNGSGGADFIDFMNRPAEKKEDVVPSYDFMPIRPAATSASPKAARSNFDSDNEDPPLRTWNSLDSRTNSSPIRNVDMPETFILGKNHRTSNVPSDGSLVSDIEKMMMKHMDTLVHAIDNVSSRLTQLETRTRNLEHSIDDLKMSVGNNHGAMDGKMKLFENILAEVQSGVNVVKDKQEILEAQMQIAKLQIPKSEQVESKINAQPDLTQTGVPTHHQFSGVPQMPGPPAAFPPPNAPPSPPQQNIQPQVQPPNQFPQSQIPSVPQRDPYFPPPNQTPENQNQQYQLPQMQPLPPQQQQQQQPLTAPSMPQHSQPPPQPHYSQPPPSAQPHSSFPPMSHHPEERLQMPPQNYSTGIRPSPPSQQYYGPTPNVYDPPPTSRPDSGYSSSFGQPSGPGEPYPYGSSFTKQQQLSSPIMGQSGGSAYPQLPIARILPQALPTASAASGGSTSVSGGSGNRVPIDDVVERVTNMGFPRDQVRATVRKLTENGQAVDLNIVLDKLMNDGDGQGPRNWFGR